MRYALALTALLSGCVITNETHITETDICTRSAYDNLSRDYKRLQDLYQKKCQEHERTRRIGHNYALLLIEKNMELEERLK